MHLHLESKKGKGRAQLMNFRVRALSSWDWRSKWEADWGVNWEERGCRWAGWWRLRMAMALSTRWGVEGEEREEKGEEEREWRWVLVRVLAKGMAVVVVGGN